MHPNKYSGSRFMERSHPEEVERNPGNPEYHPNVYPSRIKEILAGLEKEAKDEKVRQTRKHFGELRRQIEHQ